MSTLNDVLEQVSKIKDTTEQITELEKVLGNAGVSVTCEWGTKTGHKTAKRILLSNTYNSDWSAIREECNGTVVDSETWKVIAKSPPALTSAKQLDNRTINALLAKNSYNIHYAQDGTITTLYYYGGVWNMATARAYDVSMFKWLGTKTYAEGFAEAAANTKDSLASIMFNPQTGHLEIEGLDTNKCHTIGFRHSDFHPLPGDVSRIWHVRSMVIETGVIEYANEHTTYTGLRRNMRDLHDGANGGNVADGSAYGLILRPKDGGCGEHANIIVHSNLMASLERMLYNRIPRRIAGDLNTHERIDYAALHAFMHFGNDKRKFIELFPQYSDRYTRFDSFFASLTSRVSTLIRDGKKAPKHDDIIQDIAEKLAEYIQAQSCINAFDPDAAKVVKDYTMRNEYALLYIRAMSCGNTQ
jgi:hypothetical protein